MGICASSEAMEVSTTAKLILPDGQLQEYNGTVRVYQILRKEKEDMFLCNADDLDFGGYVTAVGSDDIVQPGQIYFLLPKSMLKRRLQSEDMAKLAVRASSALTKRGFVAVTVDSVDHRSTKGKVMPVVERRRRGKGFVSELSVISEYPNFCEACNFVVVAKLQ